jgi:hypothetical protein
LNHFTSAKRPKGIIDIEAFQLLDVQLRPRSASLHTTEEERLSMLGWAFFLQAACCAGVERPTAVAQESLRLRLHLFNLHQSDHA